MKRILSLVLAVFVGLGSLYACAKKKTVASNDLKGEVTVIVMDTSQALLPHADVTAGKNVLRTSWDGRVVLKPEMLAGVKKLTIACDGYKSQSVTLDDPSMPVLVRLVPSLKRVREDVYATGGRFEPGRKYESFGAARDARVLYKTASVDGAEAVAEMAMVDAERPDVMPEAHPMVVGAANNAISAGKLTAGEVNDFTKWNLWHHIIDSTHKKFLPDWRLELRQRYTVQVVNKENYPVANYPVSLLDTKGNTIFQAVTDNTGKAELWANMMTGSPRVEVRVPEKRIVVDEPCQSSIINHQSSTSEGTSDVDVVFVFDATGSMGDELRYLRAEMQDVIARAQNATGGLSIRTGAVVYRDHGDEYLTRISRLTSDISTTQAFIAQQHASGGGDFPEAVPEALMAALNSSGWNEEARARIAFLVLDAPCHKDSATIALLHEQILNAAALGVRVVPVVCSGLDKSGELLMRSIALATNGTSFFLTDDSGIGNKHLKPTTDSLKVEHLNDMLVRTIVEFSIMPSCENSEQDLENKIEEQFIPNPFEIKDIKSLDDVPHGPTTLYLMDISGKLITIIEGNFDEITLNSQLSTLHAQLPIGVYFVKAFYDDRWHTKKILVR